MRRRYDTALFRHKIEKIKEVMPHAFIGVDVIVGTRGETDEYFEEARQFIGSLDISQLHVFSYSERPGTQALKIDHVVDPKTKHDAANNSWISRIGNYMPFMRPISDRKRMSYSSIPRKTARCTVSPRTI